MNTDDNGDFVGGTLKDVQQAGMEMQVASIHLPRWIDAIGHFIAHDGKIVIDDAGTIATDAAPIMALTPFGPEYGLVLGAIVGVKKVVDASTAAGKTFTDAEKLAMAVEMVNAGVTTIMAEKGITEPAIVQPAINLFVQSVFGLAAGLAVPASLNTQAATGIPALTSDAVTGVIDAAEHIK